MGDRLASDDDEEDDTSSEACSQDSCTRAIYGCETHDVEAQYSSSSGDNEETSSLQSWQSSSPPSSTREWCGLSIEELPEYRWTRSMESESESSSKPSSTREWCGLSIEELPEYQWARSMDSESESESSSKPSSTREWCGLSVEELPEYRWARSMESESESSSKPSSTREWCGLSIEELPEYQWARSMDSESESESSSKPSSTREWCGLSIEELPEYQCARSMDSEQTTDMLASQVQEFDPNTIRPSPPSSILSLPTTELPQTSSEATIPKVTLDTVYQSLEKSRDDSDFSVETTECGIRELLKLFTLSPPPAEEEIAIVEEGSVIKETTDMLPSQVQEFDPNTIRPSPPPSILSLATTQLPWTSSKRTIPKVTVDTVYQSLEKSRDKSDFAEETTEYMLRDLIALINPTPPPAEEEIAIVEEGSVIKETSDMLPSQVQEFDPNTIRPSPPPSILSLATTQLPWTSSKRTIPKVTVDTVYQSLEKSRDKSDFAEETTEYMLRDLIALINPTPPPAEEEIAIVEEGSVIKETSDMLPSQVQEFDPNTIRPSPPSSILSLATTQLPWTSSKRTIPKVTVDTVYQSLEKSRDKSDFSEETTEYMLRDLIALINPTPPPVEEEIVIVEEGSVIKETTDMLPSQVQEFDPNTIRPSPPSSILSLATTELPQTSSDETIPKVTLDTVYQSLEKSRDDSDFSVETTECGIRELLKLFTPTPPPAEEEIVILEEGSIVKETTDMLPSQVQEFDPNTIRPSPPSSILSLATTELPRTSSDETIPKVTLDTVYQSLEKSRDKSDLSVETTESGIRESLIPPPAEEEIVIVEEGSITKENHEFTIRNVDFSHIINYESLPVQFCETIDYTDAETGAQELQSVAFEKLPENPTSHSVEMTLTTCTDSQDSEIIDTIVKFYDDNVDSVLDINQEFASFEVSSETLESKPLNELCHVELILEPSNANQEYTEDIFDDLLEMFEQTTGKTGVAPELASVRRPSVVLELEPQNGLVNSEVVPEPSAPQFEKCPHETSGDSKQLPRAASASNDLNQAVEVAKPSSTLKRKRKYFTKKDQDALCKDLSDLVTFPLRHQNPAAGKENSLMIKAKKKKTVDLSLQPSAPNTGLSLSRNLASSPALDNFDGRYGPLKLIAPKLSNENRKRAISPCLQPIAPKMQKAQTSSTLNDIVPVSTEPITSEPSTNELVNSESVAAEPVAAQAVSSQAANSEPASSELSTVSTPTNMVQSCTTRGQYSDNIINKETLVEPGGASDKSSAWKVASVEKAGVMAKVSEPIPGEPLPAVEAVRKPAKSSKKIDKNIFRPTCDICGRNYGGVHSLKRHMYLKHKRRMEIRDELEKAAKLLEAQEREEALKKKFPSNLTTINRSKISKTQASNVDISIIINRELAAAKTKRPENKQDPDPSSNTPPTTETSKRPLVTNGLGNLQDVTAPTSSVPLLENREDVTAPTSSVPSLENSEDVIAPASSLPSAGQMLNDPLVTGTQPATISSTDNCQKEAALESNVPESSHIEKEPWGLVIELLTSITEKVLENHQDLSPPVRTIKNKKQADKAAQSKDVASPSTFDMSEFLTFNEKKKNSSDRRATQPAGASGASGAAKTKNLQDVSHQTTDISLRGTTSSECPATRPAENTSVAAQSDEHQEITLPTIDISLRGTTSSECPATRPAESTSVAAQSDDHQEIVLPTIDFSLLPPLSIGD